MSDKIMEFDTGKKWEYENGFMLTSDITRLPKMIAHYELYKSIRELPGEVLEFGVFKGASFVRLCTYRDMMESPYSRKIIGFDAFGKFPSQENEEDVKFIERFENSAGDGISVEDLHKSLSLKNIKNYELIQGDINETLSVYLEERPELKISFLHIDVDVYQPTMKVLNLLYDKIVKGGVLVLDDYATVAGETKAVDEFFKEKDVLIQKLSISHIPCYIRK